MKSKKHLRAEIPSIELHIKELQSLQVIARCAGEAPLEVSLQI